jgi:hypothetical protein
VSGIGRWHLEMQVHRHPESQWPVRCGRVVAASHPVFYNIIPGSATVELRPTLEETLHAKIQRRWSEAGRPDDEEAVRAVVLATIDAEAWRLDPAKLDEMKASVKLRREQPLAPSAYVETAALGEEDEG